MFMTMMEISCQRRERWESRLSTDRRPSAFSDWSSRRISDISSSTSSQPRRRCRAGWGGRHKLLRAVRDRLSPAARRLTLLRRLLVPSLNEHVPGALREEGQQQELDGGGDAGQTQHEGPAWTQTVHLQPENQPRRAYSPPYLPVLLPSMSLMPSTCAQRMPMVMKSCGTMPRAPLRFLGASSPRYMGTTLDDRPARGTNVSVMTPP